MKRITREIVIEKGRKEETQWTVNMRLTLVSDNVVVRKEPIDLGKFSSALEGITICLEKADNSKAIIRSQKTYECADFQGKFTDVEMEGYKVVTEEHDKEIIVTSTATLAIKHHNDSSLIDGAIYDAKHACEETFPERGVVIKSASKETFFLYLDRVVMAKEPYAILALFKIRFSKITSTLFTEERVAPFVMLQ